MFHAFELQIINQATDFFLCIFGAYKFVMSTFQLCAYAIVSAHDSFVTHGKKSQFMNHHQHCLSIEFWLRVLLSSYHIVSSTETSKNGITFHRETQLLCVLNNFSGRSSLFLCWLTFLRMRRWVKSTQSQVSVCVHVYDLRISQALGSAS